jgi:hypothetical protein
VKVRAATLAIDPATPLELRIKLHCELAQYVAPRRKAAERPVMLDLPTLHGPRDAVAAAASLLEKRPLKLSTKPSCCGLPGAM